MDDSCSGRATLLHQLQVDLDGSSNDVIEEIVTCPANEITVNSIDDSYPGGGSSTQQTKDYDSISVLSEADSHSTVDSCNRSASFSWMSKKDVAKLMSEYSYELQQGFRVLQFIMSDQCKGMNKWFMSGPDFNQVDEYEYNEVVTAPIWLDNIFDNFRCMKYTSITEFVRDIRLMLINIYRLLGPDHRQTKNAVKMEQMLEQRIALLPAEIKDKCTLEATAMKKDADLDEISAFRRRSNRQSNASSNYESPLLANVKNEKAERDKLSKKKALELKKLMKQDKQKEIIQWADSLCTPEEKKQIRSMWELCQIGHFLFLARQSLNLYEVTQTELEHIFFIPRQSVALACMMTSLLSNPMNRVNLDKKLPMPYRIWSSKLKERVHLWRKTYDSKEGDSVKVFEQFGIEENFFKIFGSDFVQENKEFHDWSIHQRVWAVKSLCDFVFLFHKTVLDSISEGNVIEDQNMFNLGADGDGNWYFNFPQFCGQCLRIYRYTPVNTAEVNIERQRVKEDNDKAQAEKAHEELNHSPRKKKQRTAQSEATLARQNLFEDYSEPMTEEGFFDFNESLLRDGYLLYEVDPNPVEPSAGNFEIAVDSVVALKELVARFEKKQKDAVDGGMSVHGYFREKQLTEHLRNLLKDLEPWEQKLDHANKSLLGQLRKECDEYGAKGEYIEKERELVWSAHVISEDNQNEDDKPSQQAASDQASNSSKLPFERSCRKRTSYNLDQSEEEAGPEKKKQKNSSRLNGRAKNAPEVSGSDRKKGQSKAKELFAWETMRQILISSNQNKTGGESVASSSSVTTSPDSKPSHTQTTPPSLSIPDDPGKPDLNLPVEIFQHSYAAATNVNTSTSSFGKKLVYENSSLPVKKRDTTNVIGRPFLILKPGEKAAPNSTNKGVSCSVARTLPVNGAGDTMSVNKIPESAEVRSTVIQTAVNSELAKPTCLVSRGLSQAKNLTKLKIPTTVHSTPLPSPLDLDSPTQQTKSPVRLQNCIQGPNAKFLNFKLPIGKKAVAIQPSGSPNQSQSSNGAVGSKVVGGTQQTFLLPVKSKDGTLFYLKVTPTNKSAPSTNTQPSEPVCATPNQAKPLADTAVSSQSQGNVLNNTKGVITFSTATNKSPIVLQPVKPAIVSNSNPPPLAPLQKVVKVLPKLPNSEMPPLGPISPLIQSPVRSPVIYSPTSPIVPQKIQSPTIITQGKGKLQILTSPSVSSPLIRTLPNSVRLKTFETPNNPLQSRPGVVLRDSVKIGVQSSPTVVGSSPIQQPALSEVAIPATNKPKETLGILLANGKFIPLTPEQQLQLQQGGSVVTSTGS